MTRAERAYDRGDSDAHYGRPPRPHLWLDNLGQTVVKSADMTHFELSEYYRGYDENPSDRKEWK